MGRRNEGKETAQESEVGGYMGLNERARLWREENPALVDKYRKSFRGRYAQLKRAAKRDGRMLEISIDDYGDFMLHNVLCFYCQGPLSDYGYNLDRKDHRKGYTHDNIVACCGMKNGRRDDSCNARKGRLEQAGFEYPRTVELMLELVGRKR
jgi:hypothetical protein